MDSAADYQGLLDLSPDGVIVVRADCSILAVNDNLVSLFGYSASDLTGLPLEFLLPAACDAVKQLQAVSASSATGNGKKSTLQEYWVQNAKGSTLAVDVTLASVHSHGSAQSLVCISVRDATQRKKTEQALEEARIKSARVQSDLLHLSNTLPLAIFQWESDDTGAIKYTFVSERVQEVLAVPAERIMVDPALLYSTLLTDDARLLKDHMGQVQTQVRQGDPQASFSLAVRAQFNGALRWVRISTVYGGRRVDGRSIWNGYLEDITRRKQTEDEKELATFQFKTLWEKSPDTYLFLGRLGVLSCNASALDLFGLDQPEELIGHAIGDPGFSPPLQPNGLASASVFAQILAYASQLPHIGAQTPVPPAGVELHPVRGSVKFEWTLLRKANLAFTAEIVVTPMQIGADDGYLLICQDVSLQRQAQSELLRAKLAAEDTARTKADFLANMSHEIRTPMNAIVGLSHLVLQGELSCSQRDFINKIQDSGHHLLGIINDILDFSKMEAGKLTIEQRDFELSKVLENVTNLIGDKARSKGLELVFDVDPLVPDALHGDALRLGQILINYGNNAIKFTPSGEICIAVLPLDRGDNWVDLRFEVRDTGIGLSTAQMERLFQSFQQADTSTTRQYGGTGLGLAICKSLADLMHGQVGVESQPGRGSTFWFTTRLGRAQGNLAPGAPQTGAPQARPSVAKRLQALAGARILLVEDNDLNQLVACELLRGAGLEVEVADNGRLAIERILREPTRWDLVLMDMQMPVLDGVSATQEIRASLGTQAPTIVAMTANAMPQHRHSCLAAGMQDFITKPIDPEQLWETLLRWIAPKAPEPRALFDSPVPPQREFAGESIPHAIPGLNTEQGLKRVLGRESTYLLMLRKFIAGQSQAIADMRNALALQDWEGAERAAHTLKGVSGNIGAAQVQADASALEAALGKQAGGDVLEPLLRATEQSLSALLAALQQALPQAQQVHASQSDIRGLDSLVEQLKALLAMDDAAAIDLFGANASLLKFAFPHTFSALESALSGYDFPKALEYL